MDPARPTPPAPSSLTPPYTPAPHLTSNSFLTASQLVYYLQDFHASFERTPQAPEYLFERLVANLNSVYTTAIELEHHQQATALAACTEEKNALQLSNDQLRAELAKLKETVSVTDSLGIATTSSELQLRRPPAHRTADNPDIGSFNTSEIQSWDPERCSVTKKIYFAKDYPPPPPDVPLGLTSIYLGKYSPRLYCWGSSIKTNACNMEIFCPGRYPRLYGASCAWLELSRNDRDFQSGIFRFDMDLSGSGPQDKTTHMIRFPHSYPSPPHIVTWIRKFNFGSSKDRHLHTYATNISRTGFKLNLDTLFGSVLEDAVVSWVACTASRAKVFSGSVYARDITIDVGRHYSGYVKFGSGVFATPPRIIMTINRFDIDRQHGMFLSLRTSDITAHGMTWHVDGGSDAILYSAGGSFIALG